VVDALSRRSHGEVLCCSISVVQPKWCQSICDGYLLDEEAKRLLSKLTLSSEAATHFSLREGLIRYKDRIWLGSNVTMQHTMLHAMHSSPVGGHSCFPITY
jgi:hypothetical protein